jgi:hypothetical protein
MLVFILNSNAFLSGSYSVLIYAFILTSTPRNSPDPHRLLSSCQSEVGRVRFCRYATIPALTRFDNQIFCVAFADSIVKSISYSMSLDPIGSVSVQCEDGTSYTGDDCVVTVSIGVLKSQSIQFFPPLSQDKLKAINRIGRLQTTIILSA